MTRILTIAVACLLFASCRPDTYVPKPRGYYKVDFPKHEYQAFDNPAYPYSFEYPVYAKVSADTGNGQSKPDNPYWLNIDYPTLGARLYLSYKVISPSQPFEKLLEDAYQMSYFHDKKADYINTPKFTNKNGVSGMFYDVGGNAASAYQFYATDSVKHFLRGALYFDVSPNADSLRPINVFIKKDIDHMLETLKWNR